MSWSGINYSLQLVDVWAVGGKPGTYILLKNYVREESCSHASNELTA